MTPSPPPSDAQSGAAFPQQSVVERYEIRAPASGRVLGQVEAWSAQGIEHAARDARRAQEPWAAAGVKARAAALLEFRSVLLAQAEDWVSALTAETGKPQHEAFFFEVALLADTIGWLARQGPQILAERVVPLHLLKHRESHLYYEPKALVGVIAPWNYPLYIPFADALSALLCGSSVLVKPSPYTPLIAERVRAAWCEAQLDPDLLQIVSGGATAGQAVIAQVDHLAFTGSVDSGREVGASCARRLIPYTLELGGHAPAIVREDADVERAARALCFGAFVNSGQACIAVERVYAHHTICDQLAERCATLARELKQGDPERQEVDLGALTLPGSGERLQALVEHAVLDGAKLLSGGRAWGDRQQYFAPTVVNDCSAQSELMRHETFGPILPLASFRSDEEALALAGSSLHGLATYLFTRDESRGRRMARALRTSSVVMNDVLSQYGCPELPFGGLAESGHGLVRGEEGLRSLAELRHFSRERMRAPRSNPLAYPYSSRGYRLGLTALRGALGVRGWFDRLGL